MTASEAIDAIEAACKIVSNRNKRVIYKSLLAQLPDRVLAGLCALSPGDDNTMAVMMFLAHRAGALLHGKKNKVFDPADKEFQEMTIAVWGDVVRERLRRLGILSRFTPRRDPFSEVSDDNKVQLTLSDALPDLLPETRQWLDFVCARP